MERLLRAVKRRRLSQDYEPLERGNAADSTGSVERPSKEKFSWLEYSIFLLLGISMLWAWNMFLAAAPYFQSRFSTSSYLLTHFQPAILTVSTITNLGAMLVLTKLQANASYPGRIMTSLIINITCFTLLALSTTLFRNVSPDGYFIFLMLMVFASSLATGLCQNGVFAFVNGFGVPRYIQGIMAGQGVAGVLPCIVQIVSVLSVPEHDARDRAGQESPKSAFAYFLTATGVSAVALVAFVYLARRHPEHSSVVKTVEAVDEDEEEEQTERKVVGLWTLFLKLRWIALSIALCFAVTMLFPVFTQEILSIQTSDKIPRLLQPACFIPLAFLFWNSGDLVGRLLPLVPRLSMVRYPRGLFLLSVFRIIWIPLYLLCNIRGRGAVVPSDFFYLFVVQLLFGITNGFVGSTCMMSAAEWVEVDEREAAGGFMGLMLVGGLTVGSLLSFLAAKA